MVSAPFPTLAPAAAAHSPTEQDHQVWQLLYTRQTMLLPGKAEAEFLAGLDRVGFQPDRRPDFDTISNNLAHQTGWRLTPVDGIVEDNLFFQLLAQKIFPATWWLRSMEQLDYLPEPDMFHDVFGHVPLLANPDFARFLEGLAHTVQPYLYHPHLLELISRLYWFTVEFGLIQTQDGLRIYGAGILSSVAESSYSLGDVPQRQPFDVQRILATPFHKDRMQTEYFVIQEYSDLPACLPTLGRVLANVASVLADSAITPTEQALADAVLA